MLEDGACATDLSPDGPLFEPATWRTWTGMHRLDGILMAHGPRVERGSRLAPVEIIDVAPTILHLFGIEAPEHIEGQIPEGLLTAEARDAKPWRKPESGGDGRGGDGDREHPYSAEEERQVEERLRGLGYL